MTALKMKVRPQFDPRGSLIWSLIFGLAYGALTHRVLPPVNFNASYRWMLLALLAPVLLSVWHASRCQRRLHNFLVGSFFGIGLFLAWLSILMLTRPASDWVSLVVFFAMTCIPSVVLGHVYGWGHLLITAVFRRVVFAIVEQDDSLCWACGYCVGNPRISDRCSECGDNLQVQFERASRRERPARLMKKYARLAAIGLIAVATAMVFPRFWHKQSTSIQMATMLGRGAQTTWGGSMWQFGSHALVPRLGLNCSQREAEWFHAIPLQKDPAKAIAVAYQSSPVKGQPVMQLQLLGNYAIGGASYTGIGRPLILCNLTREQADFVLEHGVPVALIDSMLQKATETGWTPLPTGGLAVGVEVKADERHFQNPEG